MPAKTTSNHYQYTPAVKPQYTTERGRLFTYCLECNWPAYPAITPMKGVDPWLCMFHCVECGTDTYELIKSFKTRAKHRLQAAELDEERQRRTNP